MTKRSMNNEGGWLPGERFFIVMLIVVTILLIWMTRGG